MSQDDQRASDKAGASSLNGALLCPIGRMADRAFSGQVKHTGAMRESPKVA